MTGNAHFETRCLSSLSKVFADEELRDSPYAGGSMLRNETYSFQVAYRSARLLKGVKAEAEAGPGAEIAVRTVGLVPSELPVYAGHDEHVLRTTPGLYPDPLMPQEPPGMTAYPGQWRSVWVTVTLREEAEAGRLPIRIRFLASDGGLLGEETFTLDIVPLALPEQRLVHTEWFHADCLAAHYGLDVFGEEHWQVVERFVRTAVRHGVNMILTPLFTPPLDTEIGGERPTVQLIDVEKTESGYRFGFDRLTRWSDMCRRCGVRYLEFSHLFTQWGAKHAPKIVAAADGEHVKLFGWHTDAAGAEYGDFLDRFLPELLRWVEEHGWRGRCYFHTSDEPNMDHLANYAHASGVLKRWLGDYPMIDALSDYAFYEKGLVPVPIPANDHIAPFLRNGVRPLWTYYCCGQDRQVANRFFSMPSARSRILGMQLYKHDIAGFLHWGYNFWFTQYSRAAIDPFRVTDAGGAFPSGDPFLVYPGDREPIESIRLEVLREAMQDLRALELLESFIGKAAVMRLLEDGIEPILFDRYPRDPAWLLAARERVNRLLAEHATA